MNLPTATDLRFVDFGDRVQCMVCQTTITFGEKTTLKARASMMASHHKICTAAMDQNELTLAADIMSSLDPDAMHLPTMTRDEMDWAKYDQKTGLIHAGAITTSTSGERARAKCRICKNPFGKHRNRDGVCGPCYNKQNQK